MSKVTTDILDVTIKISFTPSMRRLRFSNPWKPKRVPIKIMFLKPAYADIEYSGLIKTLQFKLVY